MRNRQNDPVSQPKKRERKSLRFVLSVFIFLFLVVTMLIITGAVVILVRVGVLEYGDNPLDIWRLLLFMGIGSILFGTLFATSIGRFPLKPINRIIDALNRLSSGDFTVRMTPSPFFARFHFANELTDSFNKLAEELEHTEMLRSDFVNNFSHEFKTPIVSIVGFAGLLKEGNLSPEEEREYISIIEEESKRLVGMASSVLNLTKIENQTILSDKRKFNLSEQIRSAVLLLENKWSKRNIEFSVDFDEYEIVASPELTKQVWINLIDNAVKFADEGSVVEIRIDRYAGKYAVSIENHGREIPKDKVDLIFKKFYQADESHSVKGNGIGLAIVKKIVDLHKGAVRVSSGEGKTVFTVYLPMR